jgi:hypothetical protein
MNKKKMMMHAAEKLLQKLDRVDMNKMKGFSVTVMLDGDHDDDEDGDYDEVEEKHSKLVDEKHGKMVKKFMEEGMDEGRAHKRSMKVEDKGDD